jgi:hypothetical protein
MRPGIGIIRRQDPPAARVPPTVAAVMAFAARLARRHAAEVMTASRADLALARRPEGNVSHFHSPPRIEVFTAVPAMLVVPQSIANGFGEVEAGALFQRLFSRATRISTLASPAESSIRARQTSRGWLPSSTVVERILPHPPGRNDAPTASASTHASQQPLREQEWGGRPIPSVEVKPITLAGPEVRRVADQVLREIDHRVVAQRERLGRR